MTDYSLDSTSRRDFMKGVVAVGGASALSACLERTSGTDVPSGVDDPSTLPEGQHEWNEYLSEDDYGNVHIGNHHVLRFLTYPKDTVDGSDRQTITDSLETLERAYEWSNEGVMFTLGYSPSYFDRFDEDGPVGVGLPTPTALSEMEDPEFEPYDAVLHLASDNAEAVVEAEEAMFGEQETANGITVEARLADVFNSEDEHPDRRTGFVGGGLPAKFAEEVPDVPDGVVPEDSPLFMGFKSGFKKAQATEDRVTISDGPFAGGTTQHISSLDLNLKPWWEQDSEWQRIAKMFSPTHAEEGLVEGVGENLEDDSQMDKPMNPEDSATQFGVVGHAQKMSSVRKDDEPLILRRDFDTTDGGDAGLYFLSVHETITDFVTTRVAMTGKQLSEDTPIGQRLNNGILQYLDTQRRGNYVIPPRRHRALPTANPE